MTTGVRHWVRWWFLCQCPAGGLILQPGITDNDAHLSAFVVWLCVHNSIKPDTMSHYLTEVNQFHAAMVAGGIGYRPYSKEESPGAADLMSIVRYDLENRRTASAKTKLPININMLRAIVHSDRVDEGVKAAVLVAFFLLLRRSEVGEVYNKLLRRRETRLRRSHFKAVAVDAGDPPRMSVSVLGKGNVNNSGHTLVLGAIADDKELCPFTAVRRHFARTPDVGHDGVAFVFESGPRRGCPVTGEDITRAVKLGATLCGVDPDRYASHSCRIGGASALLKAGWSEHEIMIVGRWTSRKFLRYLRADTSRLSSAAAAMVRCNVVPVVAD